MSQDAASHDSDIELAVRRWFELAVLGLNLCPFAHQPAKNNAIRFVVKPSPVELFECLHEEIQRLHSTAANRLETTLVVVPNGFEDFWFFMEMVAEVERWLAREHYEGFVQVASFHPGYQFAGTERDSDENLTNRSPYPIFHLIREQSLSEVLDRGADADSIPERNIETVCTLSDAEKRRLFPYLYKA